MSGTILIVDAVPTSSIVLRVKLSSAFYNVRQELTGESALASLAWNCPDVLVVSSGSPCQRREAIRAAHLQKTIAGEPCIGFKTVNERV